MTELRLMPLQVSAWELAEVFSMLVEAHVQKVTGEYSGSGDDGSIEYLAFFNDRGEELNVAEAVESATWAMADNLLWQCGISFDNEGSHGSISIDVDGQRVSFDHSWYLENPSEPDPFAVEIDEGGQVVKVQNAPRPPLSSLDGDFAGDAVAELIYDTLCDRGMEPAAAAAALGERYDYEQFGRIVDYIEGGAE